MKLRPHPIFKNSGIDWLGHMPKHWLRYRLKYVSHIINGSTPSSSEPDYWDGDIQWVTPDDLGNIEGKYLSKTNRQITDDGYDSCGVTLAPTNSVVISTRAPIGHIAIIKDSMCCNQGCRIIIPNQLIFCDYLYYLLHSSKLFLNALGQGSTFKELSSVKLSSLEIVIPDYEVQHTISTFLDRETARIDALIQKKGRMIELLKEKRIALITQAVTKGLDLNVPMKDSGIEWLGEVPEHWSVKRIKYISSCNDESLPETTEPDYEMLYVDISSVSRIEGITNKEEMSFEDAPSRARRRVRDGDTIVSTVRTYLRAIAPIENAEVNLIVSTGFAVLRPVNIYSGYLSLYIQSHYVVESIVARSVGVSYPAINASDIGDIRITIPPMSEQQSIVDKVRKATLQIDELQSQNELSITLLREYRSSLINHAVSGKIDLRGGNAQAQ